MGQPTACGPSIIHPGCAGQPTGMSQRVTGARGELIVAVGGRFRRRAVRLASARLGVTRTPSHEEVEAELPPGEPGDDASLCGS
jgi:hypothetical protein